MVCAHDQRRYHHARPRSTTLDHARPRSTTRTTTRYTEPPEEVVHEKITGHLINSPFRPPSSRNHCHGFATKFTCKMQDRNDNDLLLSLQSSLRMALHTFGPESKQYQNIETMINEQIEKAAQKEMASSFEKMSIRNANTTPNAQGESMDISR
jgi:hypothetical protein